ncbi:hypothetical protein DFH11DRAFT_1212943 [Phellopilus nigrolimitatus]|nr:hypothetical protein DFH11DRAFT_1212943 [Phellopilus nigrolimitatus]
MDYHWRMSTPTRTESYFVCKVPAKHAFFKYAYAYFFSYLLSLFLLLFSFSISLTYFLRNIPPCGTPIFQVCPYFSVRFPVSAFPMFGAVFNLPEREPHSSSTYIFISPFSWFSVPVSEVSFLLYSICFRCRIRMYPVSVAFLDLLPCISHLLSIPLLLFLAFLCATCYRLYLIPFEIYQLSDSDVIE